MKDLGKHQQHQQQQAQQHSATHQQSPKQEISVHAMFDEMNMMVVGGLGGVSGDGGGSDGDGSGGGGRMGGGGESSGEGTSGSDGDRTDDDDGTEQKFTDSVMDRHLFALEADSLSMENRNTAFDIVKYMANLKMKHMEAEQQQHVVVECHTESGSEQMSKSDSSDKSASDAPPESSVRDAATAAYDTEVVSSEGESGGPVVLDYKVDKGSTTSKAAASDPESNTNTAASTSDSSGHRGARDTARLSSHSYSADRSRSTGTSPVRIIKIKSPRNSVVDTSVKRVSSTGGSHRDRSDERGSSSPDRREQSISPRRQSEGGGILKRSVSPNPDCFPPAMGILKRCQSPVFKSASSSADRFGCGYTRRSLSPGHSIDSRSPRASIDSRSPDRQPHRLYIQHDHRLGSFSPQSSFDSRASEPNLDLAAPPGVSSSTATTKGRSPAYSDRSPDRSASSRKRSLSAHSSLEKSRHSEPYYHHYYQLFQQQQQMQQQQQLAAERKHQRQSKSLERTGSKDSTTSTGSSYQYGGGHHTPVYHVDGGSVSVTRSQSAENAYLRYGAPVDGGGYGVSYIGGDGSEGMRSNESLARAIEQPTCVECLYQRKPS